MPSDSDMVSESLKKKILILSLNLADISYVGSRL